MAYLSNFPSLSRKRHTPKSPLKRGLEEPSLSPAGGGRGWKSFRGKSEPQMKLIKKMSEPLILMI